MLLLVIKNVITSPSSFTSFRVFYQLDRRLKVLYYYHHFFFSGATKAVYAPDPFDVGRTLQADITKDGLTLTLTTTGPIDPGWFTF